jgi:Zn-dependent M32 family carboxypeptidase
VPKRRKRLRKLGQASARREAFCRVLSNFVMEVSMSEKLNQLKQILGEVSDLGHAASVLSWDEQVNMPPGGSEARGQQLATLGKIVQEKFTSDEVGRLLEDLKKEYTDVDR